MAPFLHSPSTPSFPLLLLGGRRQHTVQAQIHCSFGIVVGPSTGQDQADPGARNLFSAESFRGLRQFRIVHLSQRVGAEIEGGVFRVRLSHLLDSGSRDIGGLATQQEIRFRHMGDEMAECHLVGAGFVGEFVGGHGFDGCDGVFLPAGQDVP